MRIIDLFTGIGGFSLAAHWMGWETAAFVEWNEFCQKILNKNFPGVPVFGDIKQFNGTEYRGSVDIVCGGFPCQPFSSAGNRKGKEDDRYLWPQMLRVIQEVQPTWVVGENVTGIISMDGGDVLEEICTSLEGKGYAVQSFIIPAISLGAPHRRDRIWIVGYAESNDKLRNRIPERESKKQIGGPDSEYPSNPKSERREEAWQYQCRGPAQRITGGDSGLTSDAIGERRNKGQGRPEWENKDGWKGNAWARHWHEVATRTCRVDDGLPRRVDRYRAKRLEALGNSIVPQVVYEIFKAIDENKF